MRGGERGLKKRKKQQRQRRYIIVVAVLAALAVLVAVLAFFAKGPIENALYPLKYSESVDKWAKTHEIDPYLIYAVILTESGFDPMAESTAGARGLMQMTEDTFDWIKSRIAPQEELVYEDLYEPDAAIRFGSYFFSICLQRYGQDVATAAAAYHSGWGTVDGLLADGTTYSEDGVTLTEFPYKQMNHYVAKIQKNYSKYLEIYTE